MRILYSLIYLLVYLNSFFNIISLYYYNNNKIEISFYNLNYLINEEREKKTFCGASGGKTREKSSK